MSRLVPSRTVCIVALCAAALTFSGCAEGFRFDPTGRETFAPSRGYLLEPGPFTASNTTAITVAPGEIVAAINSEVIVVSTIYGPTGQPMPGRRVEWMIAQGGVGEFVTLADRDETSFGHSIRNLPKKVNNTYATGESMAVNTLLTRGTPSRADDVALTVGQTWISVTSTIEGTSHVTAFGPDVHSWDRRRSTATISWVDAKWVPPAPAVVKTGDKHLLTTTVTRQSDGTPLVGWRVRYEILNQPAGTPSSSTDGSQVIEVATNESGKASAEIGQPSPTATTVPVNVQIFRPSDPANPNSKRAMIGNTNTQVTWIDSVPSPVTPPITPPTNPIGPTPPSVNPNPTPSPSDSSPSIEVSCTSPTEPVPVGQEALFVVNVTNRGTTPARGWTISDTFDPGLQHASNLRRISSNLNEIAPGATQSVRLRFTVTQPGKQCHVAEVATPDGQRASARGCVIGGTPTAASYKVNISGPPQVNVGGAALFNTVVTNTGATTIPRLRLVTTPDAPLLSGNSEATGGDRDGAEDARGRLVWNFTNLEPGASRTFQFRCFPVQPANQVSIKSEVVDESGNVQGDRATIDILPGNVPATAASNLKVDMTQANDVVKVGGQTKFQIVVANAGQTIDKNVVVRVAIPPQFNVVSRNTFPGQLGSTPDATNSLITFEPIKELGPGQTMNYDIVVSARQAGDVVVASQVTSQGLASPIQKSKTTTIAPE